MALRIIQISPKVTPIPADPVTAHLSIQNFKWINEQNPTENGTSPLSSMFDWIVNKKGSAYVKAGDDSIPVFGAVTPAGKQYLRCLKDSKWSDELLSLPLITF